ncbi:malonyl-ACP O-methyltransferase BioC [Schinkia azotoformans]|uniref:malonyl-ACP O-methyltransferase BioC n=1 Tax=Schinkia azotoformans TaxID=1454 RepID=UPI002DBD5EC9|nr:malonyl-ACP O-methyltransferase BioC [Schinkia azotoformans]MEC1722679.1 malonyl-ACP O-methyltransferase BioC [Schinkia azotoformans]MED4413029.1 malonyl-ACP O-methyltransferase BioC [Schinkia azotoformans]
MINKALLQKRFTKQALSYDEFANVQKKMAHHLLMLLKDVHLGEQGVIRILEIGCGTGYLTERLLQRYPHCQITAVDFAPGMIETARKKVNDQRATFICGDAEEMEFNHSYHLIISNATFQWFNQLEITIRKLFEALYTGGKIYFSTFGNLTFHELHSSFKQAQEQLLTTKKHTLGQSFFSLDVLAYICKSSLESYPIQMKYEEIHEIETFATVRDFLTSIKKIGANNSNQEAYCMNPSLFKEMIRNYECNYRIGNSIKATYHCLYFSVSSE